MLNEYKLLGKVSNELSEAADRAFEAYIDGRATEEPQITDRILATMEDCLKQGRVDHIVFNGIAWSSRTFKTSRGKAAEEKQYGADWMGVLDICLPNYETKKGFLVQSKKSEPNKRFSGRDWDRLKNQCELMIKRTPFSYIFVYSKVEGIRIFSANSVIGLKSKNIFDLYSISMRRFCEDHIRCLIGDKKIHSTNIRELDVFDDFSIRTGFHLSARASDRLEPDTVLRLEPLINE